MGVGQSRLIVVILAVLAAAGIVIAILAAVDGTLTGDWLDAAAPVDYPPVGFIILAVAGLGVLVFAAAVAGFIALLVGRSRLPGR